MSTAVTPTTPSRTMAWVAAALPFLPFAVALLVHSPPPAQDVVDLSGMWRSVGAVPQTAQELAAMPGTDVKVPGPAGLPPTLATVVTLARTFRIPPGLAGQPMLLVFGGVREGVATVFVNGQRVGWEGVPERGTKMEHLSLFGSAVDHRLVHLDGDNVVAVTLQPEGTLSVSGHIFIMERRLFLGSRTVLQPFLDRALIFQRFLELGGIFVLLFAVGLMLVLARQDKDAEERGRHFSGAALGLAVMAYLAGKSGLALALGGSRMIIPLSISLLAATIPEFMERLHNGKISRFQRINRVICAAHLCTQLFVSMELLYRLFVPYLFIIILRTGWVAIQGLRRSKSRDATGPLMLASVAALSIAGVNDLLTDLGLINSPRLFTLAAADMGFLAFLVIGGRVLRSMQDNVRLLGEVEAKATDLTAALERAEESTRLKSAFLANTSHELRTPLNSIINVPEGLLEEFIRRVFMVCNHCESVFDAPEGFKVTPTTPCPECKTVGTLKEESRWAFNGDPEASVRYLKSIQTSGRHLLAVVNDILDFSKLEAGRMTLRFEDARAAEILEKLSLAMMPLAQPRGITLAVDTPDATVRLQTDPLKLTQVLMNLVSNAIKFSHDNSVVEVRVTSPDADTLAFSVVDHGIGMADKDLNRIFESFLQLDSSHTRKYAGTGLGLAITRKLTELMGGTITVESTLGQGSSFTVTLPIKTPEAVLAANLTVIPTG